MEIIKHIILLQQFVGSIKAETKGLGAILISTGGVACRRQTRTQTHCMASIEKSNDYY